MSDKGNNRRNRRKTLTIRRTGAAFNKTDSPIYQSRLVTSSSRPQYTNLTNEQMTLVGLGLNNWQWRIKQKKYELSRDGNFMTITVNFSYIWTGELNDITIETTTASKPTGRRDTWSNSANATWNTYRRNKKGTRVVYRPSQPTNPISEGGQLAVVFDQEINAWVETTRRFCLVHNKVLKDACPFSHISETYVNDHATMLVNSDLYNKKGIGSLPPGYAGNYNVPGNHKLFDSTGKKYLEPFYEFALTPLTTAGDGDTSSILSDIQSEYGNTFLPETTTTTTTTTTAEATVTTGTTTAPQGGTASSGIQIAADIDT